MTKWGPEKSCIGKPCKPAWGNAIRLLYAILINPVAALTYQKPDYNFYQEGARISSFVLPVLSRLLTPINLREKDNGNFTYPRLAQGTEAA